LTKDWLIKSGCLSPLDLLPAPNSKNEYCTVPSYALADVAAEVLRYEAASTWTSGSEVEQYRLNPSEKEARRNFEQMNADQIAIIYNMLEVGLINERMKSEELTEMVHKLSIIETERDTCKLLLKNKSLNRLSLTSSEDYAANADIWLTTYLGWVHGMNIRLTLKPCMM
jgi:hypothetical protein